MEDALRYKIAISLLPRIGNQAARNLIAYFGSAREIFKQPAKKLEKAQYVGPQIARMVAEANPLERADQELRFIEKHGIQPLYFLDEGYPERLKHCPDAPIMLYAKGQATLNPTKALSIVGTRNATPYGLEQCRQLIANLAGRKHDVTIISGLAYGIDICAHREALKNNLRTFVVFGHGFNTIYPQPHRATAGEILKQNGAIFTEFLSDSHFYRENFLQRNRIIAGMADATIVVESAKKGGALVTADIATSYNRDVFAFPGRVGDKYSEGCNQLIRSKKAALIEKVEDLEYEMGWEAGKETKAPVQAKLFQDLTEEEQIIGNAMKVNGPLPIDHIALKANMPVSKVSSILLNMEFTGLVKSLPGKLYELSSNYPV